MVKNQAEIKAVFQSQEHDLGIYSGKNWWPVKMLACLEQGCSFASPIF